MLYCRLYIYRRYDIMLSMVSQENLKEWFTYNTTTGDLVWWRPPKKSRTRARLGKVAGIKDRHGVKRVTINGAAYRMTDLVWVWHFGTPPGEVISLIGDLSCSRIEMLCCVDDRNQLTAGAADLTGVEWNTGRCKWQVSLGETVIAEFDRLQSAYTVRLWALCKQVSFL